MATKRNEIVSLVVSFIALQIIAKGVVLLSLWLFRFFGMPQLWEWYRSLEHPGRTRFFIVLLVWMIGNIVWILRRRKV
ncbi:MAG: hypothetical protein IKQ72_12065 [Bacteroidaceae bacterium]|nr:hypothetical protein [Bacteroidaceae bacterium]